jgi:tRNA (adenine57-N1/adenine58-N1)-methyltransferase
MSDYVTVHHRDVCNDGFGLENVADAVFLDLPSPWKALASAKQALKKEGGRICSFSPCIEQVQKTVNEMTQLGFTDIYTIEMLRRVLCVKKYSLQNFDFNLDMRNLDNDNKNEENSEKRADESNKNNAKNSKKFKKNNNRESDDDSDEDMDENGDNDSHSTTYTSKPINLQPGHTSFLTFATLLHKDLQKFN